MGEFLWNNKGRLVRIMVLLFVFFIIVTFVNGRNIYKEKTKKIEERNSSISMMFKI